MTLITLMPPFLLLTLLAPPEASTPPPTLDPITYESALEDLREADLEANRDPFSSTELLAEAITKLEDFAPELAADPEAQRARQLARLNLARALLLAEDNEEASAVMDEAIRAAMSQELPAELFGPALAEFYEQRLELLEQQGHAVLLIRCAEPCEAYVNETPVEPDVPHELLLGSYRVWVEDEASSTPRKRERVELDEVGEIHELQFGLKPEPEGEPAAPRPARLMPRWAQVLLTVAGASLVGGGAIMIATDEREDFRGTSMGAVGLAVGTAALASGVLTLSVDEYRYARRDGHSAMIHWTLSF